MTEGSDPLGEVEAVHDLMELRRNNPTVRALSKVAIWEDLLVAQMGRLRDEEQRAASLRILTQNANKQWPWYNAQVAVSGVGRVLPRESTAGAEPDLVQLRNIKGISHGFYAISEITYSEELEQLSNQYLLVHVLEVPSSIRDTESDTRDVRTRFIYTLLHEADIQPVSLIGPPDIDTLKYFYGDIIHKINIATADRQEPLTAQLRKLAAIDLPSRKTMPSEDTRELLRYLNSLDLFRRGVVYGFSNAQFIGTVEDDETIPYFRKEPPPVFGTFTSFTAHDRCKVDEEGRPSHTMNVQQLGLQISTISRDRQVAGDVILPLVDGISVRVLGS